jgi:hypothetical protein
VSACTVCTEPLDDVLIVAGFDTHPICKPAAAPASLEPLRLRDELLATIVGAIRNNPRSQQTRIGPSEIGTPCTRRLAYKLAGVEPVNAGDDAWIPTVGTAIHEWLESTFVADVCSRDEEPRWLLEHSVDVGEINGEHITGKCDLYDRYTATVIDWKTVGVTALREYKRSGPGEQYRVQAHLYGRGWTRRGMPVATVAIFFLPRSGQLREAHFWHEPYDEQVAVAALERATQVARLVAVGGAAVPAMLPTADAHCAHCPFYMPAATDLTEACPGHTQTPVAAVATENTPA